MPCPVRKDAIPWRARHAVPLQDDDAMTTRTIDHPDDPLHIAVCAECRRVANAELGGVNLGRVWLHVAADAWVQPAGRVERLAVAVLRSPGLARALVTTPSLVASWIGATVVVLIVG